MAASAAEVLYSFLMLIVLSLLEIGQGHGVSHRARSVCDI